MEACLHVLVLAAIPAPAGMAGSLLAGAAPVRVTALAAGGLVTLVDALVGRWPARAAAPGGVPRAPRATRRLPIVTSATPAMVLPLLDAPAREPVAR